MKLAINLPYNKVFFKTLSAKDMFMTEEREIYMKTEDVFGKSDFPINAANLTTGELHSFEGDEEVTPIKAILRVEGIE